MTDEQILAAITRVLRDIIGDDSIVVSPATVRGDVPEWDSFRYVTFIVALETELGIKFGVAEVESFVTVGDIVAEVKRLLG